MKVTGGRLERPVNEVHSDGSSNMTAYVIICGKTYEVLGDTLTKPRQAEQTCRRGRFLVTYDEDGYAVKAKRL